MEGIVLIELIKVEHLKCGLAGVKQTGGAVGLRRRTRWVGIETAKHCNLHMGMFK